MTNSNKIDITIVLDESGSMLAQREETLSGLQEFISTQKQLPGECTLSLITFNTTNMHSPSAHIKTHFSEVNISDVPDFTYQPYGMTPLQDAVGTAISQTEIRLAAKDEDDRPGQVLIVVITDGMENTSMEYKQQQILDMVEHQSKKYAWEFIYLGASPEAWSGNQNIGIASSKSLNYDSRSAKEGLAAMNFCVSSYRRSRSAEDLDKLQSTFDKDNS